jgi:hypothetical protein
LEGRAGLEVRGAGTGNALAASEEDEEELEFSSWEELPEELWLWYSEGGCWPATGFTFPGSATPLQHFLLVIFFYFLFFYMTYILLNANAA